MQEWANAVQWASFILVEEDLIKAAMQAVEARLERHPALPKYDILIHPVPTS
jgi:hypothetical protein